jgi:hypothetical protein
VRVYNERGNVCLKARLSNDLKPGVVVISEGFWVKDFPEGDPYSLTHELVSPTSENYVLRYAGGGCPGRKGHAGIAPSIAFIEFGADYSSSDESLRHVLAIDEDCRTKLTDHVHS